MIAEKNTWKDGQLRSEFKLKHPCYGYKQNSKIWLEGGLHPMLLGRNLPTSGAGAALLGKLDYQSNILLDNADKEFGNHHKPIFTFLFLIYCAISAIKLCWYQLIVVKP